jgi:hypothetical protein
MQKIFIRSLWCGHCSANKMIGIFQLKPCFGYMLRNPKTGDLLIVHYLFKNQFRLRLIVSVDFVYNYYRSYRGYVCYKVSYQRATYTANGKS